MSMPDSISAKLVFNERSHLGAFRLHMWHRYRIWLMIRTFLSAALVLTGIILLISRGPNPMPVLMLMIGTFALLRPMIWKIMHARRLRQLSGYGQTVVYTFTPGTISINGEDQQTSVKWATLYESLATKHGLILYHAKTSYTWIPREAFDSPEHFEQVKTWATQSAIQSDQ